MRVAGFETAQTRALGFEQTRDAEERRVVVEEREHLDRPRERAQKRPGSLLRTQSPGGLLRVWNLFCAAVARAPRGMRRARRGVRLVSEFAHVCEGVDEFGARSLAVGEQARDVAPVDAASGGEQVVARASRDATQLQLARRGRVVGARARAGQREARVALDALARGKQRVPLRFVNSRALAERIFNGEERAHGRASGALHLPLVRRGVVVCRLGAGVARGGAA